jgi:hypothetical protein
MGIYHPVVSSPVTGQDWEHQSNRVRKIGNIRVIELDTRRRSFMPSIS